MKRYLIKGVTFFKDMVHFRGAITRTANKVKKESIMTKKRNKSLNRFELIWSAYSKIGYATRESMDCELEANSGVYSVFRGVCHISYGKKLLDETKLEIITRHDYNDHLFSLSLDEIYDQSPNLNYSETSVLFSFREIKRSYEMVALGALMSIGTNGEPAYWEHWLRLEDGTILTPKETLEYFAANGGIKAYIEKDPKRAKINDTKGV